MNRVVFLLFFVVVFAGFGGQFGLRKLGLIAELFSLVLFALLLPMAAKTRRLDIHIKYILLLILACLHILSGLIINMVPFGTIVLGSRPYLKWLPIFLLPIVHRFSTIDIEKILKLLLFFLIVQTPVVIFQRLIQFRDSESGDPMTGTLGAGTSGALSVLLICGIAMLVAFYVSGRLKTGVLAGLLLWLFLPTTINETKVTMFLLPIAIIVPFLFSTERRLTKRQVTTIAGVCTMLVVGYIGVYNYYQAQADRPGFGEFFSDSQRRDNYVFGQGEISASGMLSNTESPDIVGYSEEQVGEAKYARFEKIRLAYDTLSEHPVLLWTGIGLGNASESAAKQFSGTYSHMIGEISSGTLFSFLLWETGIGGVALFLVFLSFVFSDALYLAKKGGPEGTLATGWLAITMITFVLSVYLNIMLFNVLIYLFAFFSGYIASQSFRSRYNIT